MKSTHTLCSAASDDDAGRLREFYNTVFHPERVGDFGETLFHHLPRMLRRYWYMAQDRTTGDIGSALALIPWEWRFEGIPLKVAELGLVGTREECRGQGLMRDLIQAFEETLKKDHFDLAVIQGIPGFYHQFGYHFAIDLENHIDLSLDLIPEAGETAFSITPGSLDDIDFFLEQDRIHAGRFSISGHRSRAHWAYLLTESRQTEYGGEFWIIEPPASTERYYCRVQCSGFGHGLIIAEVSDGISSDAFEALLIFLRAKAVDQDKPHLRFNLHDDASAAKMAVIMGAKRSRPYAWQIKVPDKIKFLETIAPALEKRLSQSAMRHYSGVLRLDLFQEAIDLAWREGHLESIRPSDTDELDNTFCIATDLFAPLVLGYRSWPELQAIRPDIFPSNQYLRLKRHESIPQSGLMVDVLFPRTASWIYWQY